MKLHEFRQSLESDALIEKESLQKEVERLKKELEKVTEESSKKIEELQDDCRALANRCWAISAVPSSGTMCYRCQLHSYHCPHEKSFNEKVDFATRMRRLEKALGE